MVSLLTHVLNNVVVLFALYGSDHHLLKPWLAKRLKHKDVRIARWFFVHSFANALVCVFAAAPVVASIADPLNAMDSTHHTNQSFFGSASVWPLTIINSVHVYHMVGGFSLTSADYFHHLLFVPFLGFPGQVLPWGAIEPCGAFFISGLPGGISYLMLGLYKVSLKPPLAPPVALAGGARY